VDNGGASGDILDFIMRNGNRCLTRVKMNISDDEQIRYEADRWEYVEDGVCCLRHTFGSSDRTMYIFFTADNMMRSYNTAERQVDRMIDAICTFEKGKFRKADLVTVRRNVVAYIDVTVFVQTRFPYKGEEERNALILSLLDVRSGKFNLESSEQLKPVEALNKYRERSAVEHLIHFLKRITGLKPMRVWKESSIRGSMILALLSETTIVMARYELREDRMETGGNGDMVVADFRPSTESMFWSSGQLTVCRIVEKDKRKHAVHSNWDAVFRDVFADIRGDINSRSIFPA